MIFGNFFSCDKECGPPLQSDQLGPCTALASHSSESPRVTAHSCPQQASSWHLQAPPHCAAPGSSHCAVPRLLPTVLSPTSPAVLSKLPHGTPRLLPTVLSPASPRAPWRGCGYLSCSPRAGPSSEQAPKVSSDEHKHPQCTTVPFLFPACDLQSRHLLSFSHQVTALMRLQ